MIYLCTVRRLFLLIQFAGSAWAQPHVGPVVLGTVGLPPAIEAHEKEPIDADWAFPVAPHLPPESREVHAGEDLAARRAQLLDRGVNLSGWYGGWGEYTPEHLSTWTTAADFAFIHAAGLRYVRLPVDPVQLSAGGYDSPASLAALARLDKSVDEILAAGLGVSITVFPSSEYKQALLTPAGAESFLSLWKLLAAHFTSRDPEWVFFDILNEPELSDAAKWNDLQARVADVIRTVDTQHTLIATGTLYAGINELLEVTPLQDRNVVYAIHFYEPFAFTHQGATWSRSALARLKDIPYPGDPEKLGPMVASAHDPEVRDTIAAYATEGWDQTTVAHRLKQARAWADAHHVSVICNEFGAFRDTISEADRAVYLHDVRTSLESLHIPWAEWDYQGNFGIVTHGGDGSIVPAAPIFQALGLTVPARAAAPAVPAVSSTTVPASLK